MDAYVQTRGRNSDYGFLGKAPADRWWLKFGDITSFEKPTLLVCSDDGKEWKAYFSGISSARFDRVGTQIRCSIILEGEASKKEENRKAREVIAAWIEAAASPADRSELQVALDTAFPEDVVEGLLGNHSSEIIDKTRERLDHALSRLINTPHKSQRAAVPVDQNTLSAWVCSIKFENGRAAFLACVDSLLSGGKGVALMVNLVGNEEEARPIAEKYEKAAILLVDPNASFPSERFVEIQKKKMTTLLDHQNVSKIIGSGKNRNIILVAAIVILGIAILSIGLEYWDKPDAGRAKTHYSDRSMEKNIVR